MEPGEGAIAIWLGAARDPGVAAALESIFEEAHRAIAERGPACWASGRCCHFESAGHLLYTTALEAAYTLVRAGGGSTGGIGGAAGQGGRVVSLSQVGEARARGGCPFQEGNLCGVHAFKPVACRVYFCDRTAQAWQQELSERLHERVRGLHAARGIPYRYAEWRGLLEMLAGGSGPG